MADAKAQTDGAATVTPLKIAVILGTVRPDPVQGPSWLKGRLSLRVSRYVTAQLRQQPGVEVVVLDPVEYKLPLLERAYHHYGPNETRPQVLETLYGILKSCDAFVVVSGEYNHSIPPALTNFMDHFGFGVYGYKASGIVTYSNGQYAGRIAASHLRHLLGELGCISVSNMFSIPRADQEIDESGTPRDPQRLDAQAHNMIKQLLWNARAMKEYRMNNGTP